MRIIKNMKIKISEEEVLRYQGYHRKKEEKINEMVLQITREEISHGFLLVKPRGIYSKEIVTEITSTRKVYLKNNYSLDFSSSMIRFLEGVDCLMLGAVTIGRELEEKVSELFGQGDYFRAVALDAVGTVSAIYLRDYINSLVCQETRKQNLQITRVFSPGSHHWDISEQEKIFQIIPAEKIGITLTDSYMMYPQKSLSWLIGFGKKIAMPFQEQKHSCKICLAENCQFRKMID